MAAAKGACLNHISRESSDVKRLAEFYIKVFGFEQVESPKLDFEVIWLKLGSSLYLHLIERNPNAKLPEGPWSAGSAVADPRDLPRGNHVCIYVPNFDSFVQSLKDKGIQVHEVSQSDGKRKQAFFFDADGESFLHYSADYIMLKKNEPAFHWKWIGGYKPDSSSVGQLNVV